MAINYNNKNDNVLCEGVNLLQDMKIQDYNRWRMKKYEHKTTKY